MKNNRQDYCFIIQVVVINEDDIVVEKSKIPFIAEGANYVQAREKALDYMQAILRDYGKSNKNAYARVMHC